MYMFPRGNDYKEEIQIYYLLVIDGMLDSCRSISLGLAYSRCILFLYTLNSSLTKSIAGAGKVSTRLL